MCRQRDELTREAAHVQLKTLHVDLARQARVDSLLLHHAQLQSAMMPHSSAAPALAALNLIQSQPQHQLENDADDDASCSSEHDSLDEHHSIMTLDGEMMQATSQMSLSGAEALAGDPRLEASIAVGRRTRMVEQAPSSPGCFFLAVLAWLCCVLAVLMSI